MPRKNNSDQAELLSEEAKAPTLTPEQRAEYRRRLAEALKDPALRALPGFPKGSDEAILALSDPPYYTACPNPFLDEVLTEWQAERIETRRALGLPTESARYHREPFATDVSEGKNDPIYNAHSYHTKVPHKAIMRYILHYTDPGDIVFDGFCGTGMTGVAAQLCGDKKTVEALGYTVRADGVILDEGGKPISRLGARKAVLVDLSPAATFIAYNYNTPVDAHAFEREARRVLAEVEQECGWMYETWHPHCDDPHRVKGRINYTVWSDIYICPQCGAEMAFWDVAVDQKEGEIHESWNCPTCATLLSKSPGKNSGAQKAERIWETLYDRELKQTIRQARQKPVWINYRVGNVRKEKHPDAADLELISKITEKDIPYPVPLGTLPMGFNTQQPKISHGLTHIHHFYTRRNLWVLAAACHAIDSSPYARNLMWGVTGITEGSSKLNRERASGIPSKLSGTLYVASTIREIDAISFLYRKLTKLADTFAREKTFGVLTNTVSSHNVLCSDGYFDYIFVDPPFGGNLMYSELNFLWETWLGVYTNNNPEAIINNTQNKGLSEYQALMEQAFSEFYRLLKPGHWMTVEFHNSQNSVWTAIQEALQRAGFVVADVRTLDKQQGTFKQTTTTSAVKQDLIISAYKPEHSFEQRFMAEGGSTAGAWAFLQQHLEQLPLPALRGGLLEPQSERLPYLLYDRMVAFHIMRGLPVPLSSPEFYQGLGQRYLQRDGMYFTPTQLAEYDRLRLHAERVVQLQLFVTDEASAIQWLRRTLDAEQGGRPLTYGELQPLFMQELHQARHENLPELQTLLEQNFLKDETGHWYPPDPDRQADMEALRQRALLNEYRTYLPGRGRLNIFRIEAVRAGFSEAWKERRYAEIVALAERLPDAVLQEDARLKMYYDNALGRAAHEPKQEQLL